MAKVPRPKMVITRPKEAMFTIPEGMGAYQARDMQTLATPWLGDAMRAKLP